jgi:hypothetical protein
MLRFGESCRACPRNDETAANHSWSFSLFVFLLLQILRVGLSLLRRARPVRGQRAVSNSTINREYFPEARQKARGQPIIQYDAVDSALGREDDFGVAENGNRLNAPLLQRIGLLLAEARDPAKTGSDNATEERSHAKRMAETAVVPEGGFRMEDTPPDIRPGVR